MFGGNACFEFSGGRSCQASPCNLQALKCQIIANRSAKGEFETIDRQQFRWEIKEGIPAVFRPHKDPPVCFLVRVTSKGEEGGRISTMMKYIN